MNSMRATNKPFNIDKRLVYEAYKAVKSIRDRCDEVPSTSRAELLDGRNPTALDWI